jgi:hypothetical protein
LCAEIEKKGGLLDWGADQTFRQRLDKAADAVKANAGSQGI